MNMIENRRRMRGQGGFTLIELLVVIAILGVLAGVVVFAIGGINDNSKESACKIEKRTLQTASQAYRANSSSNGLYPTGFGQLVPGFLESAPVVTPAAGAKWTATFDATGATAPTFVGVGQCNGF
ncbi:MAG: type II secretion system protein [Microthrixaceae bacterium]